MMKTGKIEYVSIDSLKQVFKSGGKWIHLLEIDEIIDVTKNEAMDGMLEVARKEGLLISLSAGAVFKAFKKIAEKSGNYVLLFPDSEYKYAEQLEEYFERHGEGRGRE